MFMWFWTILSLGAPATRVSQIYVVSSCKFASKKERVGLRCFSSVKTFCENDYDYGL